MNVYVESNFVLKLALLQEQHKACEALVQMAESGQIVLLLPAYAFGESLHKLIGSHKRRENLANELRVELEQIKGSSAYSPMLQERQFEELAPYLKQTSEEDTRRFRAVRDQLLSIALVIPLEQVSLQSAAKYEKLFSKFPKGGSHDAIIYACVVQHIQQNRGNKSCFLTRNDKDFANPTIEDELEKLDCRPIYNFTDGLDYIRAQGGR